MLIITVLAALNEIRMSETNNKDLSLLNDKEIESDLYNININYLQNLNELRRQLNLKELIDEEPEKDVEKSCDLLPQKLSNADSEQAIKKNFNYNEREFDSRTSIRSNLHISRRETHVNLTSVMKLEHIDSEELSPDISCILTATDERIEEGIVNDNDRVTPRTLEVPPKKMCLTQSKGYLQLQQSKTSFREKENTAFPTTQSQNTNKEQTLDKESRNSLTSSSGNVHVNSSKTSLKKSGSYIKESSSINEALPYVNEKTICNAKKSSSDSKEFLYIKETPSSFLSSSTSYIKDRLNGKTYVEITPCFTEQEVPYKYGQSAHRETERMPSYFTEKLTYFNKDSSSIEEDRTFQDEITKVEKISLPSSAKSKDNCYYEEDAPPHIKNSSSYIKRSPSNTCTISQCKLQSSIYKGFNCSMQQSYPAEKQLRASPKVSTSRLPRLKEFIKQSSSADVRKTAPFFVKSKDKITCNAELVKDKVKTLRSEMPKVHNHQTTISPKNSLTEANKNTNCPKTSNYSEVRQSFEELFIQPNGSKRTSPNQSNYSQESLYKKAETFKDGTLNVSLPSSVLEDNLCKTAPTMRVITLTNSEKERKEIEDGDEDLEEEEENDDLPYLIRRYYEKTPSVSEISTPSTNIVSTIQPSERLSENSLISNEENLKFEEDTKTSDERLNIHLNSKLKHYLSEHSIRNSTSKSKNILKDYKIYSDYKMSAEKMLKIKSRKSKATYTAVEESSKKYDIPDGVALNPYECFDKNLDPSSLKSRSLIFNRKTQLTNLNYYEVSSSDEGMPDDDGRSKIRDKRNNITLIEEIDEASIDDSSCAKCFCFFLKR